VLPVCGEHKPALHPWDNAALAYLFSRALDLAIIERPFGKEIQKGYFLDITHITASSALSALLVV
jgi:hypothetical protein